MRENGANEALFFRNEPRRARSVAARTLTALVSPLVLLIVWQLAHSLRLVSPTLLPGPVDTLGALVRLIVSGELLPHIVMTLYRMACGFILAGVAGTALGLVMGAWRPLYDAVVPVLDALRSVPVTALYPMFVLVLGIGDASKIGMVFVGSVFVVALNSAYGVFLSNRTRSEMAYLYGASHSQVFRYILFFDALPHILIGLRIALSYSLIVALLGEMFMGSQYGIGQRLMDAYTIYAIADMYALILLTGGIGYLMNCIFIWIEHWIAPWSLR